MGATVSRNRLSAATAAYAALSASIRRRLVPRPSRFFRHEVVLPHFHRPPLCAGVARKLL